jgi:hypothetical protein
VFYKLNFNPDFALAINCGLQILAAALVSKILFLNIIPDIAIGIYYGLQTLAATLVSRFCSST